MGSYLQNPVWKKGELPHSCTEICGKSLNTDPKHSQCQHKCKQLCHPGPCPTCAATVQVSCPCKKSISEMRCNMAVNVRPCNSTCERKLTCGRHSCSQPCHHGECDSCSFEITQSCYCNKSKRTVLCSELQIDISVKEGEGIQYSCKQPCSR
ncbi:Transcriptional repressor NF-X1 [Oopsacas minuta]|uniref:Transcriptional repressor NF-X1 n=1 Tax=Oopsacas minuta TaxID=111878 RepID=A0AAV7JK21_9METZ|nr:Transcriptional repressor NF-X1 [Oopsacas minuta]